VALEDGFERGNANALAHNVYKRMGARVDFC